jgi:hypothetical protein
MTPTEVFERAGRTLFGHEYIASLADFLGVEMNTIDKWRDGKSRVPPEVWSNIFDAVEEQERAMAALRKQLFTLVDRRLDGAVEVDRQTTARGIFPAITMDFELLRRFSRSRRRT